MKISLGKKEIIHFIGVGGIGMSGLALIMKSMGFKIHGSDISANKNIERLNVYENKTPIYDLFFTMSHGVNRGILKSDKTDDWKYENLRC